MPRRQTILQNEFPYSLTARSNNREWFALPMHLCWDIFQQQIAVTAERYNLQTHCFVLMSNHFHWIATTPDSNIDVAMRFFMTETSRRLARESGRINRIYGRRYKGVVLARPGYVANTLRYFYQNPVRARICAHVDDYPWTTRSPYSRIVVTPYKDAFGLVPDAPAQLRDWLNTVPPGPYAEMMRNALRRSSFQFPRDPKTQRHYSDSAFLQATSDTASGRKVPGTQSCVRNFSRAL